MQPRHCLCTSASRGLSAIIEFLVDISQSAEVTFARRNASTSSCDLGRLPVFTVCGPLQVIPLETWRNELLLASRR